MNQKLVAKLDNKGNHTIAYFCPQTRLTTKMPIMTRGQQHTKTVNNLWHKLY